ncbi:MAG: HAMP domain-containing histidine kinase [Clostridia bacterium]|nr:HAMP domain-containing histidine kinase [Clostridia bacterium]
MDFDFKFKSIAVRWFANIFLILAAAVIIVAVLLSAFLSTSYMERVRSLGNDYVYDFSVLKQTDSDNFKDVAVSVSESFAYKDKIEVQIFDKKGNLFLSTTGILGDNYTAPDYDKALKSKDNIGSYKGKNYGGEKIYAETTAVYDQSGEYLGAYRWVTSLKATNRQITFDILLIVLLSIVVLAICLVSGRFFIKSIVRPIRDVSNMSRRIALGEFDEKIEIDSDDEIGELCSAINTMADELKRAETMKNDFISSVSHELRTPLTAIKGWGETAKMSLGTDEELVGRGLDVVLSEADRLSNLVEELLDFSRMQSGRLTVNTRPINIVDIISVATDMYTELAKKQGVEVSYSKPEFEAMVLGDPDRIKQVFINIIDNAVKYTEKGGLVLVTVEPEEGCVKIIIKDTGVGIPAQDIDRVKEKFFKSNKTVRGSGIGLAVADEIMKQHNGLLFLESTEGVGTTVTAVFPNYEPPEEQPIMETEEVILSKEDEIPETEEIKEETDKLPEDIFETDGEIELKEED